MDGDIIFDADISVHGELMIYDIVSWQKFLQANKAKKGELVWRLKHENPSRSQWAYLHGVVCKVALESETFGGWSVQEFKDYYSDKFLDYDREIRNLDGTRYIRRIKVDLKTLSKGEMRLFVDKIINDLATMDIYMPEQKIETKKYYVEKKS